MKLKTALNSIFIGMLIGMPIAIAGGISQIGQAEIIPEEDIRIETEVVTELHTEKETFKKTTDEHIQPYTVYDFIPLPAELQQYVCKTAAEYEINPLVVYALMWQESRFKTEAINSTSVEHSVGLMQINIYWHEDRMDRLGITDVFDPEQNILLGIDYLAELMNYNSRTDITLEWVIMAYNAGPSGADEMTAQGIATEYAQSVMEKLLEYSEMVGCYGGFT